MATLESASTFKIHPSRQERYELGKHLRDACPRSSHADWTPSPRRHDVLQLLEESSRGRVRELIPIRYGRMLQSPFTFYRGAALNMAADLAATPVTGARVQPKKAARPRGVPRVASSPQAGIPIRGGCRGSRARAS